MINQHQGFIKEVTMIITMKRKSVIEFNEIKGTRVMNTNHDTHNLFICHLAVGIFLDLADDLSGCTNWYEHPSRCFELVDKCFRKILRCSTDMDSIVWAYIKIKGNKQKVGGEELTRGRITYTKVHVDSVISTSRQ